MMPAYTSSDGVESLNEELRIANARLKALIDLGVELASERDPDRLLHRVCAAACTLFGATYASLGTIDRSDGRVQRCVTCGAASCDVNVADWIKAGDSLSGILEIVVAERQARRGTNAGGDPARLQLPVLHPAVESFLAAPIQSPRHVYGWICLVRTGGGTFTASDEHLVMALSAQVGRIYENLSLSAVVEKRAMELEQEVVERTQVESALRHERNWAQRYLNTAQVMLIALDTTGRITLVNRYGCSILGWSADELLGRHWIDTCVPERTRETWKRLLPLVVAGDLPVGTNPILTKSGEERLIEWRNTVLLDDAGNEAGTFSSGTDVTRQNQAVEALRTAEERMRFALEAARVGIWDVDLTTGVVQWSAILESQYGLQPGTFGGTYEAFLERVHPEDRAALEDTMAKAERSGADFSTRHRALWPDGTVRWLSGAGRIHLGEYGKPTRGVGISLDVTERHTLEERYQQAQKTEAIGRLAGTVAHDFNNLLTAILGYCELLLLDLGPDDPRRADLTEIQKAGTSAAGLTRQLLAFSRKQIIQPTLLDLKIVVNDMRAMLERLIGEDVQIALGLPPELVLLKADRGQVEQVIMNLALNARDAMPTGGTLTIETANVDVDEHHARTQAALKPGPYVVLTVTDTGVGIREDARAHLFEPFFTTKGVGKGTGLGLATVDGIAAGYGGGVDVCSEVGMGTSFKVYFPRADRTETAVAAPPRVARPQPGHETVLVVDDASGIRELARRLLERQGYTTLLAATADEALQIFERNASVDLLLTDVVMPGTSGPELSRQLLAQRPELKVIYMSGYTDEAVVRHGLLNSEIPFLHKPFTSATLGQRIREVLDSGSGTCRPEQRQRELEWSHEWGATPGASASTRQ